MGEPIWKGRSRDEPGFLEEIAHKPMARITLSILLLLAASSGPAVASLQGEAEQAVRLHGIDLDDVGIAVVDPSTGRMLIDINSSTARIPASNMKLLTSGTAARVLGADFRYRTRLISTSDDLVVLGSGDPAFGDSVLLGRMTDAKGQSMNIESFLDLWTNPAVDAGIKEVDELIIDDRIFDREYTHPSWPSEQLVNRYCAGVAGLNFHRNIIRFYPRPGTRGANVNHVSPATRTLDVTNRIKCDQSKPDSSLVRVSRKHGTNEITLSGNVTVPMRVPVEVTVHDAPGFFASLLAERLESRGIDVETVRLATRNDPDFQGPNIGPAIVSPLQLILERCNHDSYNLYAEALLKTIGSKATGAPGSFANGSRAIEEAVRDQDASHAANLQVADGSGMSRDNRIAPASLAYWLAGFDPSEADDTLFIESLPTPGQGTLENRFGNRNLGGATVHAKSGYLNGVCSLSGYVTTPDGRRLTFSIIVNDRNTPARQAKKMQEHIVEQLAHSLASVARG